MPLQQAYTLILLCSAVLYAMAKQIILESSPDKWRIELKNEWDVSVLLPATGV